MVKVWEHIVGEIWNRSARSWLSKPSRSLIRVNNISFLYDSFVVLGIILVFRFTFLYDVLLFAPLQCFKLDKNGDKREKITVYKLNKFFSSWMQSCYLHYIFSLFFAFLSCKVRWSMIWLKHFYWFIFHMGLMKYMNAQMILLT